MQTVEHLVLKVAWIMGGLKGMKFHTKYHDDLGSDLQDALEVLEQEGWELVTAWGGHPNVGVVELILKRQPR